MFDLFFQKYKSTFHRGGIKNIETKEWIMLLIIPVSGIFSICFSMFKTNLLASLLFVFAIIIDIILFTIYEHKKEINNIDKRISNYKENVIKELIILLSDEQYNLYTLDGLNWMINCCEEHIDSKKENKSLISSTIFPIFTLVYGVIIKNMDIYNIIITTTMIILIIVFFNVLYNNSIHDLINNPDKTLYQSLKRELEYIRTQIVRKNPTNDH